MHERFLRPDQIDRPGLNGHLLRRADHQADSIRQTRLRGGLGPELDVTVHGIDSSNVQSEAAGELDCIVALPATDVDRRLATRRGEPAELVPETVGAARIE